MNLHVENVSYAYQGGLPVFSGLSFTYQTPQILCILGPNGTGKSTLLQCLTGIFRPLSGKICYDGQALTDFSTRELAKRLAYLPQAHIPAFSFSVLEVVTMGRTAHLGYLSAPARRDREIAHSKLSFLGIARLAERPYTKLSGGERQLVMLAAALAQEPELILLDEPTAHLDFGNQQRFLALVSRLKEQGIGVIMTSHMPEHALNHADKTLVMQGKEDWCYGESRQLLVSERLSRLYGLKVELLLWQDCLLCVPDNQNKKEKLLARK